MRRRAFRVPRSGIWASSATQYTRIATLAPTSQAVTSPEYAPRCIQVWRRRLSMDRADEARREAVPGRAFERAPAQAGRGRIPLGAPAKEPPGQERSRPGETVPTQVGTTGAGEAARRQLGRAAHGSYGAGTRSSAVVVAASGPGLGPALGRAPGTDGVRRAGPCRS